MKWARGPVVRREEEADTLCLWKPSAGNRLSMAVCAVASHRSSESFRVTELPYVNKPKECCFYKPQPWTDISRALHRENRDPFLVEMLLLPRVGCGRTWPLPSDCRIWFLALWSWKTCLHSAWLSFLICYKGMIIAGLQGCWEIYVKALKTAPACSRSTEVYRSVTHWCSRTVTVGVAPAKGLTRLGSRSLL